MPSRIRLHAIYTVLGEFDLLRASIASIYPHTDGITIVTTYDRDWKRNAVAPDALVASVLDRSIDPDRKIDLLVSHETNEARNRNRAMDFAMQWQRRYVAQHAGDKPIAPIDYFWIVDADEIYTSEAVDALKDFASTRRKRYYQVLGVPYFKTWNYRIPGDHFFTALVRADRRLGARRNPYPNVPSKILGRLKAPPSILARVQGITRVPPEVAYFHHGSYVGPRDRIRDKVRSFSHSDEIPSDWVERVWDNWRPGTENFHPVAPTAFSSALHVPTEELPPEIAQFEWPEGYLD